MQYNQLLCCILLVIKLLWRIAGGLGGPCASNIMEGAAAHPPLLLEQLKEENRHPCNEDSSELQSFGNSMCSL